MRFMMVVSAAAATGRARNGAPCLITYQSGPIRMEARLREIQRERKGEAEADAQQNCFTCAHTRALSMPIATRNTRFFPWGVRPRHRRGSEALKGREPCVKRTGAVTGSAPAGSRSSRHPSRRQESASLALRMRRSRWRTRRRRVSFRPTAPTFGVVLRRTLDGSSGSADGPIPTDHTGLHAELGKWIPAVRWLGHVPLPAGRWLRDVSGSCES